MRSYPSYAGLAEVGDKPRFSILGPIPTLGHKTVKVEEVEREDILGQSRWNAVASSHGPPPPPRQVMGVLPSQLKPVAGDLQRTARRAWLVSLELGEHMGQAPHLGGLQARRGWAEERGEGQRAAELGMDSTQHLLGWRMHKHFPRMGRPCRIELDGDFTQKRPPRCRDLNDRSFYTSQSYNWYKKQLAFFIISIVLHYHVMFNGCKLVHQDKS